MPQNEYNQLRQEFEQFREKLYQSFNKRRDTLMDLVDEIAHFEIKTPDNKSKFSCDEVTADSIALYTFSRSPVTASKLLDSMVLAFSPRLNYNHTKLP